MNPLHTVWNLVDDWAVRSQSKARRNAMLACTLLAKNRAELLEVEEFFAARHPSRASQGHAMPSVTISAR
ncbi:hypothetical protein [Nocardioides jensenii]|uniref:hypothetical protein n=1 Tax=Nocardioides jensenii TaxID=1843 RepID=UPI00082DF324|nr:hypothetical protein [Nocardioides jensenii]